MRALGRNPDRVQFATHTCRLDDKQGQWLGNCPTVCLQRGLAPALAVIVATASLHSINESFGPVCGVPAQGGRTAGVRIVGSGRPSSCRGRSCKRSLAEEAVVNTVMRMAIVGGLLAGVPGIAAAQQPARSRARPHPTHAYKREVPRRLLAQTKISEDSALKIAMARMPGAKVRAVELENEHGHLIWSWELKLAGKAGIEEVNVNALDGSIVGVEHENPEAERHDTTRARPRPRP